MSTVTCPACGEISSSGKTFCADCGTVLPVLCSQCNAQLMPGKKFCADCGAPVTDTIVPAKRTHDVTAAPASLPAPPTPFVREERAWVQEERRLISALFCDLVGFTPLSESLDPEEVRDLQAEYFNAMAEQIERYGGTVEKYAGDAVLALFGTPIAHEDDAERAVLCALGMQESIVPVALAARTRWNVEFAIRVGVNTGEVVSGTWDASGRQDVAVTGDALNTAARIQATAEPGEILVGAETMRLTRRRIQYGERRQVTLKGKVGLVPLWPASGVRDEFGERWEGYETPLVGRDREMVQLLDGWARAQGGEGQLVTVVGDAGVGKSRLLAEFLVTIAPSSAVRILRARCLSYGEGISLWLVADLLRSLVGIKGQETLAAVALKLQGAVPALIEDATTRAEAIDVFGEVLGLPIGTSPVARAGPQVRRYALIRSIRAVLGGVAQRAPTVLVLEDLHWMDHASREVLTEVLADVVGQRMLVVAAHRPGWTAPWSEWGWPERLTLRPLGEREAATLAGAVLGGVTLSPTLEQHVADRAGGNPFFVEEMLRALQETGGITLQDGQMQLVPGAVERLPSTLTEVLLARLDRLEAETKGLAQAASVIGRSFAVPLLAETVGQGATELDRPLSQLQRAEIAFPRRNPDPEYVFKHVSMRDAAYQTLTSRRRAQLHLQTARAIAVLYPPDEYVEMIAYHYGRTEAPEAAEWLEKAGDRAAAVYANEEAMGHYGEARTRCTQHGTDDETLARLEEKLGMVLITAGRYDEALDHLERAVETYGAQRDLEAAGRVTARMGMTHRYRGTLEEGIALVPPMLDLLVRSGPSPSLASLNLSLASLFFLVGRYGEMRDMAERAGEIARAIGDERLLAEAEERRATALNMLGQPEEALRIFQRAIPLIEAGGDLWVLFRALNNAGVACWQLGRLAKCREYTERALGVVERMGNPDQTAFILGNLGSTLIDLGDWDEAEEHLERAMVLLGEGRTASAATPLTYLGQLALFQGRWEEAGRWLSEALRQGQRVGDRTVLQQVPAHLAWLDVLSGSPEEAIGRLEELVLADNADLFMFPPLAWAYLESGAVDRAEEIIAAAIRRARAEGQRLYLLEALLVAGMIHTRQERYAEAEEALREGLELARSLPVPYTEGRILHQLGLLEQHRGHPEQARTWLNEGLTIFRRLGAQKDAKMSERTLTAGSTV